MTPLRRSFRPATARSRKNAWPRPWLAAALVALAALCLPAVPVRAGLRADVAAAELGRRYDDELLVRASRSRDAATRLAAARAAGRLADERAVRWLLPLTGDDSGPIRRAALFALGQLGLHGTSSVFMPLRAALPRLSPNDLPAALEALGKTGDPRAVSEVTPRLAAPDGAQRGQAALALFRLDDPSALPELLGALERESLPEPRWRMVYASWRLLRTRRRRAGGGPLRGESEWIAVLRRCADAARPRHERIFALRALATLAGQRAWLSGLLADPDPALRVAALRGLAGPWERATGERAAARLDDGDPLVRRAALDLLVAGGEAAVPLLESGLAKLAFDRDPGLRIAAERFLLRHDAGRPVALPERAGAWDEERAWRVNAWSVEAAALPDRLPLTVRGRQAAAEVCGEPHVPDGRARAVLYALLADTDFTVQALAIGSLARRGEASAAERIVAAARRSRGTGRLDVRVAAAEALAKLKRFDPWLAEAAATDPDAPVRRAAADAMRALDRKPPRAPPPRGLRLHGYDTAGLLRAAQALRGARVVLETDRGAIELALYPDEAPVNCVNFAVLVREGFYTGLTWHRVVANFVVQGGCPRGDGWGGPGYLVPDEIGTRPYVRGTVGLPKAGNDTGGCQLFITHLPAPHLDGRYSVFAQVVRGLAVVDRLRVGDRIRSARVRLAAGHSDGR